MRLLIDENFNHRILRGLIVRLPTLDHLVAQNTELRGAKDPSLLAWAAELNRILVTHDIKTIPKYAYERVVAGQPMPGVIVVPETLDIGEAIEQLSMAVECLEQSELENQVMHLRL
jgi:predicted nuclease of predicted toxin-antitoxin system